VVHMTPPRALVVDNNTSLAATVGELLAESGFEVEVVASGVDALVVWRRQPADLVVVDVDLPDIGGLTLARRLLRRAAGCKLLVMSAGESQGLLDLCEELGVAFLAKPFSAARLAAMVRRMAEHAAGASQPGACGVARAERAPLCARGPRALLPQHGRPSRGG